MIWLTVALGVAVLAVLVLVAVARGDRPAADGQADDVDPLFPTGIAVAGAGVALAVTIGGFMYALVAAGLIVMAIGAGRTRQRHR